MPSVDAVRTITSDLYRWLLRPRVRLTVTGLALLFIGVVFAPGSVWTLPLVIGGAVMIAIAWIGSRLEGHFTVEFGSDGTQFHCGARVKPHPALAAPAAEIAPTSAAAPAAEIAPPSAAEARTSEPAVVAVAAAAVPHADVVEGSAHTVEIEVAELEALIAAAGELSKS